MTVNVKVLFEAKDAEAVQTTQYTSINARTIIDKFTATNTTAASLTLTVNLLPGGGAASNSNMIVKAKGLATGETYTFPEIVGHTLAPGGMISTSASATGVTIRASGRELT